MDLCEALQVRPGDVIALVGGGGKTTALYRLGRELAARGVPAVLSGTARFTPPHGGSAPNLTLLPPESPPVALPASSHPVTVTTGHGSQGRLLPVTPAWVDGLRRLHPDWCIVLEADGSAMRPFKAPAAHEPVIPLSASLIVPIVGLDALGRPLDATHVHRPERVVALTDAKLGAPVDETMVARVLLHGEGGRKAIPPGARWVPLLNKAETPERIARAEALARLLLVATERVVIAHLRAELPVVRIVLR